MINGVILTPLKLITHPQGDILHAMKRSDPGFDGFGEAYFSTIFKGEIKGWRKHYQMTLNLVVPVGEIRFVLYDCQKESSTQGEFQEIVLSVKNYCRLTVPPLIYFAFQGVGEDLNLLLNLASIEHDPAESFNVSLNSIEYYWTK